jgi:hypothetical protein
MVSPEFPQLALYLRFYAFLQLLDYRWELIYHSMPDYIEINIEIAMDETVTHGNNIAPGYIRTSPLPFLRNLAGSFAKYLDIFYQRKCQHPVGIEILPAFAGDEGNGFPCRI